MARKKTKWTKKKKTNKPSTTVQERYDNETGQMYKETIITAPSETSWIHESPNMHLVWKQQSGSPGVSTFTSMIVRELLNHLQDLTPELLRHLSWTAGKRIWAGIASRRINSFHLWRTFVAAYPEEFPILRGYHKKWVETPSLPIQDYLNPISSKSLEWVTVLSISTPVVTPAELVNVAKMTNLVALDITFPTGDGRGPHHIDDRVIRTWNEMACTDGTFDHLRVLLIRNQNLVTENMFEHLNGFGSLCSIAVEHCGGFSGQGPYNWEKKAFECGWKLRDMEACYKDIRSQTVDSTDSTWSPHYALLRNLYRSSKKFLDKFQSTKEQQLADSVPLMAFHLGPKCTPFHGDDQENRMTDPLYHHNEEGKMKMICFDRMEPFPTAKGLTDSKKRKHENVVEEGREKKKSEIGLRKPSLKQSKGESLEDLLSSFAPSDGCERRA